MTIQERKVKEKEELRALILESAMKHFVSKGVEQTTIRNIADSIHYSVGTVYVYFKDKNEILYALHLLGFSKLSLYFSSLFTLEDPMERLRKMGLLYIQFAIENSALYDLMFSMTAPMECLDTKDENQWEEGKATFEYLKNTVSECMLKGKFKGHLLEPLSFLIWSTVHGMCSLQIKNRVKRISIEKPDTIVEDAYLEFLKIFDAL